MLCAKCSLHPADLPALLCVSCGHGVDATPLTIGETMSVERETKPGDCETMTQKTETTARDLASVRDIESLMQLADHIREHFLSTQNYEGAARTRDVMIMLREKEPWRSDDRWGLLLKIHEFFQTLTDHGWFDKIAEDVHPDVINELCDRLTKLIKEIGGLELPRSTVGCTTVPEPKKVATAITKHEGKKYLRTIRSAVDPKQAVEIDVYAVLKAFKVTCPGRQQAIKKLLCTGQRGKGDEAADLKGALAALNRAIELQAEGEHFAATYEHVAEPETGEETFINQDQRLLPASVRCHGCGLPFTFGVKYCKVPTKDSPSFVVDYYHEHCVRKPT